MSVLILHSFVFLVAFFAGYFAKECFSRLSNQNTDGLLEVIEQDHENTELLLKIDSDVFFEDLPKKQYATLKVEHRKI